MENNEEFDTLICHYQFKFEFEFHIIKGCVRYIFASLFCMSKIEHLRNEENAFYFTSKALLVLEIINF